MFKSGPKKSKNRNNFKKKGEKKGKTSTNPKHSPSFLLRLGFFVLANPILDDAKENSSEEEKDVKKKSP